jgi:hypothetical protein
VGERIAVITANLGKFEKTLWFKQKNIPTAKLVLFTDENFPPRLKSLTPRLQARIPKCFGWQLVPDYDIYLWMDAGFGLLTGGVEWMRERLGNKDIVVFKHPHRKTVSEELKFLKTKQPYLIARFENDFFDNWNDDPLYACGIFMYRNIPKVRDMLKEWWYYQTRFSLNDQLSFPTVLKQFGCSVNVIPDHIYETHHFPRARTSRIG